MSLFSPSLRIITDIARIAFNFTKSDYKTILFPVIFYGIMAAPHVSFERILQLALWVWLYLLQFCAANQMLSREEDNINKPYRPIPAGLISVRHTKILRWILFPVCLVLSWFYGVIYPGLSLAAAFVVYNELGLDSFFYTKNFLNAIGIVSWNVGAAKITRAGLATTPHGNEWLAPYISTLLIATTIHVQDFRDEAGDRKQGRITFPVVLPEFSRRMTLVLVMTWSFGLGAFWASGLTVLASATFVGLGLYIGLRVMFQRTEPEDKVTLQLYMLWLSIAQILPFWTVRSDSSTQQFANKFTHRISSILSM
ncbi:UbiA prenyltransferase family-domain-containing protein [Mycena maculata]|uniref:UbiA prenyltransferase family-domain-containing protein n=1 Tax=Mycena maculata TaxID=230809 RepID=A0AAD7K8E6_9AGAR|nr:UbiA prenyltransferase family-domain-containing protein [Mycena maculata]